MIEAGAYGLPIIASDHPGNRTYIEQGRSGFLVEHCNPQALADAIVSMVERRSELPAMGRRSREIAEQYSWHSIAKRYDAFIRSTIRR
jgi:glycosyltransferase involved in cell wall biosynthesis